jgi:hypothetical protein
VAVASTGGIRSTDPVASLPSNDDGGRLVWLVWS